MRVDEQTDKLHALRFNTINSNYEPDKFFIDLEEDFEF